MTNVYTKELRDELAYKIINSQIMESLNEKGIPKRDGINSITARAVGFNKRGKFLVQRERTEGSNVIWQRHYAKGCPELLEYISRYNICREINVEPPRPELYIAGITRGALVENDFVIKLLEPSTADMGCEKVDAYRAWVADLPNWGELYTPNGLNFVAVSYLYALLKENSEAVPPSVPNSVVMHICDSYDSPYKIRFCQGVPSKAGANDNWPELYQSELVLLCGKSILKDPYAAPLEVPLAAPVLCPTCPLVDLISDLEAELSEAEREAALAKLVEGLSFLLPADSASNVELPESMADIQAMQANIDKAMELHNQLAAYKPTTKEWI